ncbi:MAG TPA: transcriptional repressor [Thermotogota bacterium]|nr:transcriptional repressor [Thermotogota bacterium]
MRFTKNRQRIFEILSHAKKPLTAEQIKRTLEASSISFDAKMNLSTIYRAIDYLEKRSYVDSASFGKNVRFFFCKDKFKHFLYCEKCQNIQVFDQCMAQSLEEMVLKKYHFNIHSHIFYFTGLCENCKGE